MYNIFLVLLLGLARPFSGNQAPTLIPPEFNYAHLSMTHRTTNHDYHESVGCFNLSIFETRSILSSAPDT
jgi:hypothetical protein